MSRQNRKYELKARAEKLAETRRRIVEAAAALHTEVGPAQTTMAEIARRAGVQRPTVYNHFRDMSELFAACGDLSLARNPPPDTTLSLTMDDPAERVRAILSVFYAWYRQTARARENLQRDRLLIPALDAAMRIRMDQPVAELVDGLAAGFTPGRQPATGLRAVLGLALDFWTWRRLTTEGIPDDHAAALMVGAVTAAAELDVVTHLKRRSRSLT